MAVNRTHIDRTVDLKVVSGVNENGKEIIKKLRFKNVKNAASDDNIMGFAKDVEKVLVSTINELLLDENYTLTITA